MKIRRGWSGEISTNQWVKFDIELEQNDLDALVTEEIPEALGNLTVSEAYKLLGVQAQLIMLIDVAGSMKQAGSDITGVTAQIVEVKAKRADILGKISNRLNNES